VDKEKYLEELTDVVLKEIKTFEIVTPQLFKDFYLKKAEELNLKDKIDVDDLNNTALFEKFVKLQEQTKQNVKDLSKNVSLAKDAILKKDTKALTEVNSKVDELLDTIKHLEKQVYIDELTKAYNRRYLFEKIVTDDAFLDSGVVTFIDLDRFKYINDTFGHIIGDKVLMMTVKMLSEIKMSEIIRYGGDEFIVISKLSHQEVDSFFKTLTMKLQKKSFKHHDKKFKIGFSYGIENFSKGESYSKLVEKVDEVMYQQKREKKEKEKELAVA